jgi:hypothetical protein
MILLYFVMVLVVTILLSFMSSSPTSSTSTSSDLTCNEAIHLDHTCKTVDEICHAKDSFELMVENENVCRAWGPYYRKVVVVPLFNSKCKTC